MAAGKNAILQLNAIFSPPYLFLFLRQQAFGFSTVTSKHICHKGKQSCFKWEITQSSLPCRMDFLAVARSEGKTRVRTALSELLSRFGVLLL